MVSKTIAIAILIVLVTIISLSVANRKHASLGGSRVSLKQYPSRRLLGRYKFCDGDADCGGLGWCNKKDTFTNKKGVTRYYCYKLKPTNKVKPWGCSSRNQCESYCCVGGKCIAKHQKKKGSSCSEHCECKSESCTDFTGFGLLKKTCD